MLNNEEHNRASFNFHGRKVLVTGSSRGIGRAIALAFAKAGAALVLHDKTACDDLTHTRALVDRYKVPCEVWLCDLSNNHEVLTSLETFPADVDILILNASVEYREVLLQHSLHHVQQQINCNYLSNILLLQHCVPGMQKAGWGRVVALGSGQEVNPNPQLAVYASLKKAQTHYLQILASEVAAHGITVNTVAPGVISTSRNQHVLADQEFRRQVINKIPVGYIGEADDCVGAVLFMASDLAKYITGTWLPVDGGFHLA